VTEPPGGAHRNWQAAARAIQQAVSAALVELTPLSSGELVQQRYRKFRRMGIFEETS
jgi:acetyl-CoA carboxylase carboxyl transferase subunit alpha